MDQQAGQSRSFSLRSQVSTGRENTPDARSSRSLPKDAHSTALQVQPTVDEDDALAAADRKASLRRSAASRIRYNLPAGKLPSLKKRNRKSYRVTGVLDLHNITAKLGCSEVRDAIRDVASRGDQL